MIHMYFFLCEESVYVSSFLLGVFLFISLLIHKVYLHIKYIKRLVIRTCNLDGRVGLRENRYMHMDD